MLSYGSNIRKYEQFITEFWNKLTVGDYVKVVKVKENTAKAPHTFIGHIIAKYPTYILVQNQKHIRECFHRDTFYCRDMLITDYAPAKKKNWVNSGDDVESNIKICQNEIDPFKSISEGIVRG